MDAHVRHCTLRLPTGAFPCFPCLTLKYRRQRMGLFRALHRNIALSELAFVRASPRTTALFRRRNNAPLSQTCTAGACACSCKSRRAPRSRKPDGKLSRHGLGARRVALLAPRGVLNRYRHPLGYVGAITKILVKFKCPSRILGDVNSIPSGGGVPEGRRGALAPMSEDGIRSVFEHDVQLDRTSPEYVENSGCVLLIFGHNSGTTGRGRKTPG